MHSHTSERPPFALRKRITLVTLAIALIAGGGVWASKRQSSTAEAEKTAAETPETLEFSTNDVALVEQRALVRQLNLSGSLTTPTQALVKSRVAGQVLRVDVREGESVRKGQALVQLDQSDLQARLDAATADQEERRARLTIAKANRDNNQALMDRHFISRNAVDQTESAYQAALAAVRWAEAQTRLAQSALTDTLIRAPIDGFVAKRLVNAGDRVSPESPLLNVVALSRLELEATIPVSDVPQVAIGQTVHFTVDGFGQRRFEGRIDRINPVTETGTRAIRVFANVANADGSLRGGMFVTGMVDTGATESLPVVPSSAVFEEAGQRYVFAIEQGKLQKRAVQVGKADAASGAVTILSGLDAGAHVVKIRMPGLKDGNPASIKTGTAGA